MKNRNFILQTTYYNYNYGSVLQCYATQQYFRNFGIECYLICRKDNGWEKIKNGIKRKVQTNVRLMLYPELKLKQKQLKESSLSSRQKISSTSKKCLDDFMLKEIKVITGSQKKLKHISQQQQCILCVAGSDQIWNAVRVVLDDTYFLTFAPKYKRVAIAPSFGVDKLPNYNKQVYKKFLDGFSKLSVREKSGQKIIENLIGRSVDVFLDPVFLLSRKYWEIFSEKSSKIEIVDKYVFAFFLDEPNDEAIVHLQLLIKRGYKIFSIGYKHDRFSALLEINILDGGPEDFVKLIKEAAIICTDSFHVTAISSIMRANFWVYKRSYLGNSQSTRLIDYLERMKLQYRYNSMKIYFPELTEEEKQHITSEIEQNLKEFNRYIDLK
ncbi:polysaccharide pyruvyl transferase family protein [[Clostridium] spiroforme]|nr:polysaccharide pyruvyl transferase family protein [Thomasclavelia spiroformis]